MYYFLSIICGSLIAIMIAINGNLSNGYGAYLSAVIIHVIGLILISVLMMLKKESFLIKEKLPLYCFLGGAIGVATTVFNNLAFKELSVSAILALGLLGQSICSIIIDHFGILNMPKQTFNKKKLIGIAFVIMGIGTILSI